MFWFMMTILNLQQWSQIILFNILWTIQTMILFVVVLIITQQIQSSTSLIYVPYQLTSQCIKQQSLSTFSFNAKCFWKVFCITKMNSSHKRKCNVWLEPRSQLSCELFSKTSYINIYHYFYQNNSWMIFKKKKKEREIQ